MRILLLLLRSLAASLLNPVYWAAVYLTCRKYHKGGEHAGRKTRQSIFTGIAAGSLAMAMICILGLTVQPGMYLASPLPTALLLSRIRSRFCCFAYSGTLLGLLGVADVPGVLVIGRSTSMRTEGKTRRRRIRRPRRNWPIRRDAS